MNKTFYVLCLIVFLSLVTNCKSRKGAHIQILDEAKQIQKALHNTTDFEVPELKFLTKILGKDAIYRWKISNNNGILFESIAPYRDYKNPGSPEKFTYAITGDFDLVLLEEK